jgi:hypothetical protein
MGLKQRPPILVEAAFRPDTFVRFAKDPALVTCFLFLAASSHDLELGSKRGLYGTSASSKPGSTYLGSAKLQYTPYAPHGCIT